MLYDHTMAGHVAIYISKHLTVQAYMKGLKHQLYRINFRSRYRFSNVLDSSYHTQGPCL